MGILDSVLGSVLGGGNRAPGQPIGSGMSPMMKALMLALAAKAYHDYRNRGAAPSGPMPSGPGPDPSVGGGGGLGGLLGGLGGGGLAGGLGGLLAGLGGAGALGGLVDQFRQKGFGDQVNSWVGTGQIKRSLPISSTRRLDRTRSISCRVNSRCRAINCCRSFQTSCRARSTI
jgi:uncharacterized protein YidB (DUF937 family)